MTIQRLDLPEGLPLTIINDPGRIADRALERFVGRIVVLQPGVYDITPQGEDIVEAPAREELTVVG